MSVGPILREAGWGGLPTIEENRCHPSQMWGRRQISGGRPCSPELLISGVSRNNDPYNFQYVALNENFEQVPVYYPKAFVTPEGVRFYRLPSGKWSAYHNSMVNNTWANDYEIISDCIANEKLVDQILDYLKQAGV